MAAGLADGLGVAVVTLALGLEPVGLVLGVGVGVGVGPAGPPGDGAVAAGLLAAAPGAGVSVPLQPLRPSARDQEDAEAGAPRSRAPLHDRQRTPSRKASTRRINRVAAASSYDGSEESANRCWSPG